MKKYNRLIMLSVIKTKVYKYILLYFAAFLITCIVEIPAIVELNYIELLKVVGYKLVDESIIVILFSIINILTIVLIINKIFSYEIENCFEETFLRIDVKKWLVNKIEIIYLLLVMIIILKYIILFIFIMNIKYILFAFIIESIIILLLTIIICMILYKTKLNK